jgi:WD40 repeat protein
MFACKRLVLDGRIVVAVALCGWGLGLLLAGCEGPAAGPATTPPPPRGGKPPLPPTVIPSAAALSPDGKRALVGYTQRVVSKVEEAPGGKVAKLWDLRTGKLVRTIEGHDGGVCFVAFLPDGNAISAGGTTVKRWDLSTGKQVWSANSHSSGIGRAALSPDGKRLLTWGSEGEWTTATSSSLKLIDVRTGKLLRVYDDYRSMGVGRMTFAPKPDLAFIHFAREGDRQLAMVLLDVNTGKGAESFGWEQSWKYPLAFSPDGELALAHRTPAKLGAKGRPVLWDLASGREVRAFDLRREEDANQPTFTVAATFTPDGRRVQAIDADGKLRTWDLDGKELRSAPLDPPWAEVNVFSADARRLLRASGEQKWGAGIRITLWDTTGGKELLTIKD